MKKNYLSFLIVASIFLMGIFAACTKEGPAGVPGKDGVDGTDGTNGSDGTAGCIQCHSPESVDLVAVQYEFSKHSYGEAAFEESGNVVCTPCHAQRAFLYVVENNVPSTFTLNTTTNKYVNSYQTAITDAYGEIGCATCHSAIHATYEPGDLALTTVAPVSMTMWGGAKTIDVTPDGGQSNLCIKCHQPRPLTASAGDGNVIDYNTLASDPTAIFYNPESTTNKLKPGYRTHVHYGAAGAVYSGTGGVPFTGSATIENSLHTSIASCQSCHMATMNGRAGGHTFFTKGNFNGCNTTGCHTDLNASSETFWVTPRANIKAGLDALAAGLYYNGINILNMDPDQEANLWYANTTDHYDGYLNIYDPINNPNGPEFNSLGQFQNPNPSNSWSQEQKDYNLTLPKITLTNGQMGAIVNFQLSLRDFSLGIHNYKYTKALLTNSLEAI